jgi:hypothetical protein
MKFLSIRLRLRQEKQNYKSKNKTKTKSKVSTQILSYNSLEMIHFLKFRITNIFKTLNKRLF